jgi:hypothetical protein
MASKKQLMQSLAHMIRWSISPRKNGFTRIRGATLRGRRDCVAGVEQRLRVLKCSDRTGPLISMLLHKEAKNEG